MPLRRMKPGLRVRDCLKEGRTSTKLDEEDDSGSIADSRTAAISFGGIPARADNCASFSICLNGIWESCAGQRIPLVAIAKQRIIPSSAFMLSPSHRAFAAGVVIDGNLGGVRGFSWWED